MKALKEKRVSLRSLFRRSLVILSIFALAFAFAACGDGDNGNGNGNGPNQPPPPPPPPPAPRVVTSVELLNPEVIGWNATLGAQIGYQGLTPDLVGARVWLTWNDGVREHVQITAANRDDFYTYPVAPDWPGTKADNTTEPIRIGHTSNANPLSHSNSFMYDWVVQLYEFRVHSMGYRTWYADQTPEFVTNWRAEGTWGFEYITLTPTLASGWDDDDTSLDPATTQVNGASDLANTRVWKTEEIPFQRGYPVLDFTRIMESGGAPSELVIVAMVGSLEPGTVVLRPGTDPSLEPTNLKEAHIRLDKFLQVETVEVASSGPDFVIFSDQFVGVEALQTGVGFDRDEAATIALRRTTLLNLIRDNDVRFRVIYEDGENRVITWDEFQRNREYFAWMTGRDMHSLPLFFGHDPLTDETDPLESDILVWDEEDPYWGFTIGYVGRMFENDTHVVRVTPRLPVFEFEGFRETNPVVRLGPNVQIDERVALPSDIRAITGLLEGLNSRWQVWGDYAREGSPNRQRAIPLVAAMFPAVGGEVPLWPGDASDAWGRGVLLSNWPLTVEWVDGAQTEEDEGTILIDVMGSRAPASTNQVPIQTGFNIVIPGNVDSDEMPILNTGTAANQWNNSSINDPATNNWRVVAVSWDQRNGEFVDGTTRVATVTLRAESSPANNYIFSATHPDGNGITQSDGTLAAIGVTVNTTESSILVPNSVRVISNTFREIRVRFLVDVIDT